MPKVAKTPINARIPVDLHDAVDEWRDAQTAKPTLTSTVERALELLLETFPPYETK